jgi:hypothetical protein
MTILSYDDLMEEAVLTSQSHLRGAILTIDSEFDDGYAEKHPDLIGKFMEATARHYATAVSVKLAEERAAADVKFAWGLGEGLEQIGAALLKMTGAVEEMAAAVESLSQKVRP